MFFSLRPCYELSYLRSIFRQASLDFGINDPSGTFYVTTSYKVTKKKKGALTNEEQSSFIKYLAYRQNNNLLTQQEYIFGLMEQELE